MKRTCKYCKTKLIEDHLGCYDQIPIRRCPDCRAIYFSCVENKS